MVELNTDIEYQVNSFRRYGGLVYNSSSEAVSSFLDREEDVKEEVVYDNEVTIDDQQPDANGYTSTHTANIKVTAYYTDPGEAEYAYVVEIEENIQ